MTDEKELIENIARAIGFESIRTNCNFRHLSFDDMEMIVRKHLECPDSSLEKARAVEWRKTAHRSLSALDLPSIKAAARAEALEESPAVIVHIEAGSLVPQSYHAFGNVRLFIVDENCPADRVYEITTRAPPELFSEIIREDDVVGHKNDERHAAIENRVNAALEGRTRFEVIDGDA